MGKDCCGGNNTVSKKAAAAKTAHSENNSATAAKAAKTSKKGAAKHIEEEEEDDEDLEFNEDDILDSNIDRAALAKLMVEQLKAKANEKFESLPSHLKQRIQALKKLQADYDDNKKAFDDEIFALEQKYAALNKPLFAKRVEIVSGAVEVQASDLKEEDQAKFTPITADEKGIPDFWVTVLQNSELSDMVMDYDIPALKHLTNIECISHKKEYELLFHFSKNEFFTNEILKKSYVFEETEEGSQEQPHAIVGSEINWKAGKNLTVETITTKSKAKKGKAAKPIVKTEPRSSFFNFFESLEFPDEEASDVEEVMEEFNFEFEMGDEIRERVIPMAVLYYTGELVRMPDVPDFGEGDDDFDDEDFEDEDFDSEEEVPQLVGKKGAKAAAAKKAENIKDVFPQQKAGDQPPECKQQ